MNKYVTTTNSRTFANAKSSNPPAWTSDKFDFQAGSIEEERARIWRSRLLYEADIYDQVNYRIIQMEEVA